MAVRSMTGFGQVQGDVTIGTDKSVRWTWEVKAVNGRGLDLRFRLPSGYDRIEPVLRRNAKQLVRGSVSVNLWLDIDQSSSQISVDQSALDAVVDASKALVAEGVSTSPTADGLLGLKGVLVHQEKALGDEDQALLEAGLIGSFGEAIASLMVARDTEGAELTSALKKMVAEMKELVARITQHVPELVAHHQLQLQSSLTELLGDKAFSEDRLAQEVALLATKSDVREEIDRLDGHLLTADQLLEKGGTVGRDLDFLAQELMREANTLTTKVSTLSLKQDGLGLKRLVDQFKEQVQNVL